jgi:hypothetical protein
MNIFSPNADFPVSKCRKPCPFASPAGSFPGPSSRQALWTHDKEMRMKMDLFNKRHQASINQTPQTGHLNQASAYRRD